MRKLNQEVVKVTSLKSR